MSKLLSEEQLAAIVYHVKLGIIFGRLRPRERLVEEELCAQFDVSRHTVRMALSALEQRGLITRRPNRGAIVRDLSIKEIEEMWEMRALLHREAASRITFPVGNELLANLEDNFAEYSLEIERKNLQRVCKLNNRFHFLIFEASRQEYLLQLIRSVEEEALPVRCHGIGNPSSLRQAQAEHARMIDALRHGRRDEFVQLCVEHSQISLTAYRQAHGLWADIDPDEIAPRVAAGGKR